MKNIRIGILHNGQDSSVTYANQLKEQITDQSVLVDINAPRYIKEMLPIRAVPNIMVCLFCDGMEEYQAVEDVLNQLNYIKAQDENEADYAENLDIIAELVEELEGK